VSLLRASASGQERGWHSAGLAEQLQEKGPENGKQKAAGGLAELRARSGLAVPSPSSQSSQSSAWFPVRCLAAASWPPMAERRQEEQAKSNNWKISRKSALSVA